MSLASTQTSGIDSASAASAVITTTQPEAIVMDRKRTQRWMLTAGVVIGLAGAWAFWPQTRQAEPIVVAEAKAFQNAVVPLDLKAFDAPVWTLAAIPPPPPPPPAPPPVLAEQLLAVSLADAAPSAMFYKPSEDRIITVHIGDSVGGRTIQSITAKKVQLVWKPGTKLQQIETLFTDPRDAPGVGGGK